MSGPSQEDDAAQVRHQLAGELFLAAVDLPASEQLAYLQNQCPGDADLVAEVLSMVQSSAAEEHFLSRPILEGVEPLRRTIGPYRLLQMIGEGGMGEVWLVEQTHPIRRRAALKLIKAGLATKEVVARFESERQALATLDHAAVAKVFEAGSTPDGMPYFLMEYVPGIPITAHCDSHRMSNHERLQLFLQVCEGVQHAHDNGIIHRDLKPSNILVAIKDGVAAPKIIDFGVAKATSQPLTERTVYTRIGSMIGTPEYMSPEQAGVTSQDVDTRTDVYSLGVILYELLAGSLPFDSDLMRKSGYEGIRRMLLEEDPPPPSAKLRTSALDSQKTPLRTVPGDLDRITLKAMDKDRLRRYASPIALAADIRRYLAGEPVQARPSTIGYRTAKFMRRNRTGVLAGALVAAVLAAFGFAMKAGVFSTPGVKVEEDSIAVIPLKDLGQQKDQEHFVDGLLEELQRTFRRAGWRVTYPESISQLQDTGNVREIGRKLNVRRVLSGTFKRYDNRAKISIQVFDTADARTIWSEDFDPSMSDFLQAEGEITRATARAMGISRKASTTIQPVSPIAKKAYNEGKDLLGRNNTESFKAAVKLFDKSIRISPLFAKAWAGLAAAKQAQANVAEGSFADARKAVDEALRLDPELAEAHTILGNIKLYQDWDWAGAETAFRRGLELEPNNRDTLFGASILAKSQGHLEEALELVKKASNLNPLSPVDQSELGLTLHYMGRHEEAIASLKKSLALNKDHGASHAILCRAYLAMGDAKKGLEEALAEPHPIFRNYTLAMAYYELGRTKESDTAIAALIKDNSKDAPYNIAEAYAFRGEKDKAFEWLHRAVAERDTALGPEILCDPLIAPLRVDARFLEIAKKMNLPR